MNARAMAEPIVSRVEFDGEDWLYFRSIVPKVAIIRATTADERGNLSYEHEGGLLGPLDQALAVRNNGGIVIAQVKRVVEAGSLNTQAVFVPGILVDAIVVAPDQMQTTQTVYDPAISGEVRRPLRMSAWPYHSAPSTSSARWRLIAAMLVFHIARQSWSPNSFQHFHRYS